MSIASVGMDHLKIARRTGSFWKEQVKFARVAEGSRPKIERLALSAPLAGRYVVSTSDGIFGLRDQHLITLSHLPAFGIAVTKNGAFATSWMGQQTYVVRSDDAIDLDAPGSMRWQILFTERVRDSAGRFHQLGHHDDAVWIANTARNALTKIDARTGQWKANVCPFVCSFGHPIDTDHNHVNSVWPRAHYLIFTAFKIFRQGAVGIMGDGRINIFRTPNMGIHDCFFSGPDFHYSDSFNFNENRPHGSVYVNTARVDDPHLEAHRDGFVRGLARHGAELLVGSSCLAADRAQRLAGRGHVLVARDGMFTDRIEIPAGQIYDVVRLDGEHSDAAGVPTSFDAANARLVEIFGPPVQTTTIAECFVGQSAKKFDDSDLGDIPEYLAGVAPAARAAGPAVAFPASPLPTAPASA